VALLFGGSSDTGKSRIAATLTLNSGERLDGHAIVNSGGHLRDVLNSSTSFVEFEKRDQAIIYVSKYSIQMAVSSELPRNDQLQRRMRDLNAFDPHLVLGVDRNAAPAEIRAAYRSKARAYHPDKLAGVGAPKEVADYMNAMFVRIHAAYKELSGEKDPVPV
jgi:DnaJ-like protein